MAIFSDPITGAEDLGESIIGLISKFIPDADAAGKAQLSIALQELTAQAASDASQAAINQVEAAAPSLFVSGARPFILWICALAFAETVTFPIFAAIGIHLPALDPGLFSSVMLGMLGLAGIRSFDKVKGMTK